MTIEKIKKSKFRCPYCSEILERENITHYFSHEETKAKIRDIGDPFENDITTGERHIICNYCKNDIFKEVNEYYKNLEKESGDLQTYLIIRRYM